METNKLKTKYRKTARKIKHLKEAIQACHTENLKSNLGLELKIAEHEKEEIIKQIYNLELAE